MRNLLNQLEDRQSILLMYLADELSAADRAEVDRLLATDDLLQEQLDELRASQRSLDRALSEIDAANPVPGSRSAAGRQFGRAVQQWHIDRLARPRDDDARRMRFGWWTYPLATAAAVTVAVLVWWQTLGPVKQPGDLTELNPGSTAGLVDGMTDSAIEEPATYAVALESLDDGSASSSLAEVERELRVVQSLRESSVQ